MLYEKIKVGSRELKNRLVMPPMATDLPKNNLVSDELLVHYGERARYAGPGLIIVEHSYIAGHGRAAEWQLSVASDETIVGHRRLSETIHAGGSLAMLQLNHAGSAAKPADGSRPVSASDLANPRLSAAQPPRAMSRDEIAAAGELFLRAALRACEAGYDGVELHSAHGYLFNQFYSPLTNKRCDEYGGMLENRCRFLLETAARVREAIGPEKLLAVRLGGADYMPGGATEEDAVGACRLLEQAGVDLLDISGGMCGFVLKDRSAPGYFASMTEKIKAAVSVPVLLTGGVTRP